jgi:hypothetical protein
MSPLFASPLALFADLTPASLKDLGVALCLFTFLFGFVMWFIHYVRLDKPEEPANEWDT